MPGQNLLSVADVAEYLGISKTTVRRLIANGELPARKIGQQIRIAPKDVGRLGKPVTSFAELRGGSVG